MSFVPQYRLTPRIQRQLSGIDQVGWVLRAVRLDSNWIEELRAGVQVKDALASVQIEGASITLETAFKLAKNVDTAGDELNDHELEFLNYLKAFEAVDGLRGKKEEVLTRRDLLNLHGLIVKNARGAHKSAGSIRKESVKIGNNAGENAKIFHEPPEPWEIESLLNALFEWFETAKEKGTSKNPSNTWTHPAIVAGITQHRLVWIHPFLDGNGRTARMFTTLILFQRGYDFKYLFNLSEYYNADRTKYYRALRTADETGDYTDWLEYFLGGFARQMYRIEELAISKAEGVDKRGRR